MTPAIRFPHETTLATASDVLEALGCIVSDLGRPGDRSDVSRIMRRSLQPHIGHATISHEAGVVILSSPAGSPLPGDRWMSEYQFETGAVSALRLIASAAHDLTSRIVSSIRERRPGVPTRLADDLGAAAAVERARAIWMIHAPHDTIGVCPETPWSPAAWIGPDSSRGDPVPNGIAAMLVPLVEVRAVRTGSRSTAKISAHPVVVGPVDPVARMRAVADAANHEDAE
jgi:hypothetical protein